MEFDGPHAKEKNGYNKKLLNFGIGNDKTYRKEKMQSPDKTYRKGKMQSAIIR